MTVEMYRPFSPAQLDPNTFDAREIAHRLLVLIVASFEVQLKNPLMMIRSLLARHIHWIKYIVKGVVHAVVKWHNSNRKKYNYAQYWPMTIFWLDWTIRKYLINSSKEQTYFCFKIFHISLNSCLSYFCTFFAKKKKKNIIDMF